MELLRGMAQRGMRSDARTLFVMVWSMAGDLLSTQMKVMRFVQFLSKAEPETASTVGSVFFEAVRLLRLRGEYDRMLSWTIESLSALARRQEPGQCAWCVRESG